MTEQLSPTPIFKAFGNGGMPLAGGLLYTYAAGTSTPLGTFQDSIGTPNTNPIVLNFRGEASIWLDPSLTYKFELTDSLGNTIPGYPVDNIIGGFDLSLLVIGQFLYPVLPGEIGVTAIWYPYGNVLRYGMVADGLTDNTIAFQNALTSNANLYPVVVPAAVNFYQLTSYVSAPANTHIILGEGAWLLWTATTATGPNFLGTATSPGIVIAGDNFKLEGRGTLTGPATGAAGSGAGGGGVTAFVSNEFCIVGIGASASNRGTGIYIQDVQIALWGQGGIATQFMQDIYIKDCWIHDVGYQGIVHLSAQNSRVHRNKVYGIAPGTSSNAYGIQHSHDSTAYSSDPNASTLPRQTVNPFCIDVDVAFNEVRDVPVWNGIDFHGGFECRVHHNAIYNCHRAIQLGASSGAAANYAGDDNSITDNIVYGPQINGDATTDAHGFQAGIVVNGGSTITHRSIRVAGNHIIAVGHASATPSVYCVEASYCNDLVFSLNTFRACLGRAFYCSNSSGVITDNYLDSVGGSATGSYCFYLDSNCSTFSVQGNIHNPITGTTTAYTNGISMPGSGYGRVVIEGNDFTPTTTPYNGVSSLSRGSSELVATLTDTTTGSHTGTIATLGAAPQVLYLYNGGSPATLTDLTGGTPGQIVNIYTVSNTTFTVNDSGGSIRLSGGTAALPQFATLTLLCVATSSVQFVEIGRSLSNT